MAHSCRMNGAPGDGHLLPSSYGGFGLRRERRSRFAREPTLCEEAAKVGPPRFVAHSHPETWAFEGRCFALNRPYLASLSSSVRYFGASSITFLMNAASCAASILGGGVVRVATGVPISLKNSSWPAGEQMQSILTGFDEALWNW